MDADQIIVTNWDARTLPTGYRSLREGPRHMEMPGVSLVVASLAGLAELKQVTEIFSYCTTVPVRFNGARGPDAFAAEVG